jgi:uncharacterized protein
VKLQPDRIEGVNAITAFAPGMVRVDDQGFTSSVVVPWRGEVQPWPCTAFEQLRAEHFEHLLALGPELVIFGSGRRLRFAAPSLMRALIERRVGVETMDTAAACRTYNVLAGEGRLVVAALLLESPGVAHGSAS